MTNSKGDSTKASTKGVTRSLRSGIINLDKRQQQAQTRRVSKLAHASELSSISGTASKRRCDDKVGEATDHGAAKDRDAEVQCSGMASQSTMIGHPDASLELKESGAMETSNKLQHEQSLLPNPAARPGPPIQLTPGPSIDFVEPMIQLRNALTSFLSQYNRPPLAVPATSTSAAKSESILSSTQVWGNLLSEYADQPHVELSSSNFTIGRSSRCNLQLRDNSVSGLVCRISYSPTVPPSLESCTSSGVLSVNRIMLRKGGKCILKSGDRITIAAAVKPCSYIFQQLANLPALPCTGTGLVPNPVTLGELAHAQLREYSHFSVGHGKRHASEIPRPSKQKCLESEDSPPKVIEQTCDVTPPASKSSDSGNRRPVEARNTGSDIAKDTPRGALDHTASTSKVSEKFGRLQDEKLRCKEAFQKMIVNPQDITVSFDNFPYFVTTETKQLLVSSCFPFLKRPQFLKYTSSVLSMNRCFLISGAPGTEIYQEKLVQALCRELGVHLLLFDNIPRHSVGENKCIFPFPYARSVGPVQDIKQNSMSSNGFDAKEWEIARSKMLAVQDESSELLGDELPISSDLVGRSEVAVLPTFISDNVPNSSMETVPSQGERQLKFKYGDRVKYMGLPNKREDLGSLNCCSSSLSSYPKSISNSSGLLPDIPPLFSRIGLGGRQNEPVRGPLVGYKGRVVLTFEDNPSKVGVRFDNPLSGGNNLGNRCEDDHGFFVNANELRSESECSWDDSAEIVALEALVETALNWECVAHSVLTTSLREESATVGSMGSVCEADIVTPCSRPCVLFLPDVEKLVLANYERYSNFKKQLDNLPTDSPLVVIGSSITPVSELEGKKERPSGTASLLFSKSGGGYSSLLDLSLFDTITGRLDERLKKSSKASKMLGKLFPVKVELHAPRGGKELAQWNRQIAADIETLRCKENMCTLGRYLHQSHIICDKFPESQLKEKILDGCAIQKVISWAVSRYLESTDTDQIVTKNGCLVISEESLGHAIEMLLAVEAEAASIDQSLRDVVPENEFEKRLLQEAVIPSIEVSVKFDDVGALERAKKSLQELVMLPLQRPELFTRGQLTTPCKGILLFGPPGTGKTMLAKAVATEAGAHFLAITMSNIGSKWFGEGEKYVKSLFSLASKIAPTVIFIDEVDSILGKREKHGEHEAMRKIKNEFMSNWDGLRTKPYERVIVLAATNRPFDLDDAVLRRFPRRIMVDLPTAEQREKILQVILQAEELEEGFDYKKLAADEFTNGFSGSDLKNLCVAAAYQPIRELLRKESDAKESLQQSMCRGSPRASVQLKTKCSLRPLSLADFETAKREISASMSEDSFTMQEIRKWNDIYGDGGSRRAATLSYYM